MLAAIAVFAACEENDKDNAKQDLDGKWTVHTGTMMDSNHPVDITFEGDSYVWHVGGYMPEKEEGTYTYENDVITLTGKAFFTCEVDWSQQGGPVETGAWASAELIYPNHKYKVTSLETDLMAVENQGEDSLPEKFIMTRGDASPSESDLTGTWEGSSTSGKTYRISFNGKDFTRWEVFEQYGRIAEGGDYVTFRACIKEKGSWEYKDGVLELIPSQRWNSYILHADQYASPLYYEFSQIDETTFEAATWYEITSADLWHSYWGLLKVKDALYVEIKYSNMDYFIATKK